MTGTRMPSEKTNHGGRCFPGLKANLRHGICDAQYTLHVYAQQERPCPGAVPSAPVPAAQASPDRTQRHPQRPQGVAKVDLSTAFSAASALQRPEAGPAQQLGRRGSTARGSKPAGPSRLAKSSSAAAPSAYTSRTGKFRS